MRGFKNSNWSDVDRKKYEEIFESSRRERDSNNNHTKKKELYKSKI